MASIGPYQGWQAGGATLSVVATTPAIGSTTQPAYAFVSEVVFDAPTGMVIVDADIAVLPIDGKADTFTAIGQPVDGGASWKFVVKHQGYFDNDTEPRSAAGYLTVAEIGG